MSKGECIGLLNIEMYVLHVSLRLRRCIDRRLIKKEGLWNKTVIVIGDTTIRGYCKTKRRVTAILPIVP